MNTIHNKSPFFFFSIILMVFLAGISYIYYRNYIPTNTITWEDASLKITTNSGGCPPAFPCYETYILDTENNIWHNGEKKGRLSTSQAKKIIQKAFDLYSNNICTPLYENKTTQKYELNLDSRIYNFGSNGCKEMQEAITAFEEADNI